MMRRKWLRLRNATPLGRAGLLLVAVLIAVALFARGLVIADTTTDKGVNWWLLEGATNSGKECADLAPDYGDDGAAWYQLKLEGDTLGNGTWRGGGLEVTISNMTATGFNWSANLGVDAVVVKNGTDGASFYVYDGLSANTNGTIGTLPDGPPDGSGFERDVEETFDGNLTSPTDKAISHISFCFDYELMATKTADTAFTRTYTWDISKSVDEPAHSGFAGDAFVSNYTVAVDQTTTDTNYAVSGEIAITNPAPFAVTFGVEDDVNGTPATVTCPTYTLAAAASTTCTYAVVLGDTLPPDGTNTATITSETADVGGTSATAPYAFGAPTKVVGHETVNVTDTQPESTAPWTADKDESWTYAGHFACSTDEGLYSNGVYTFSVPNTATITETDQSANQSVDVTCYLPTASKDADTSYTREFTWAIDKTVDANVHSGFAGDAFVSNYTVSVDQTVDEYAFAVAGSITVDNPHPNAALTVGIADSVGGTAATLDCGGTLVVPAGGSAACGYSAALGSKTDGTNTATVTLPSGHELVATAPYAFGEPTAVVGYETVNVTDTQPEATAPWTANKDESWTYAGHFACSTDEGLYSNGTYSFSVPNRATITETGQSADQNVAVTCYLPTASKDADTSYTREFTWAIDKSVDENAHTGFAGDDFVSNYTVVVDQTVDEYAFAVAGSITVDNPHPNAALTVGIADSVGGTAATLDCGGTLVVPAGGSAACGYSAALGSKTDGTNTATVTLPSGHELVATAPYAFGEPTTVVGYETINVTDTQPDTTAPWMASGDASWEYPGKFVCPTDESSYSNGVYSFSVPNRATITETGQNADQNVDVTCYDPAAAQVVKMIDQGAEAIGQFPLEFELHDPSGAVVETLSLAEATVTGDGTYTLDFTTELKAEGTWTVEEILPDGWVSTTDLTCSFDVTYPGSAGETYGCTFDNVEKSRVDVLKLTNGEATTQQMWSFALYEGPDGFGGSELAGDATPPALLDFGGVDLDPLQTYTLCEREVPAGYASLWQVDTDGDGVGDTVVTPYNPNADDDPPEDLGNRCVDFGAGTGVSLAAGETLHFVVDNQQTGGIPRTPGYWKNWNRCSNGNQADVADRNGGWQEGYWLLEDVIDPNSDAPGAGIIWDDILEDEFVFPIETCEVAVDILDKRAVDDPLIRKDGKKMASDPLFNLATHLLAAQLNFAAGACTTPDVLATALDAETLLDTYNFDGNGHDELQKKDPDAQLAIALASYLDRYNNGEFCGGGGD